MKKRLFVFVLVLLMVAGFTSMVWAVYVPIEERGYANPEALISAEELSEIMARVTL
jgi:thiosulfate/3-mercaptopyruvate sulfurtransferase